MKPQVSPVSRVGSLYIKPNWRYELLQNPAKYKMQDLAFVPPTGASCLKRYLTFGVPYEVNYKLPESVRYYLNNLDDEEGKLLLRLWKRAFKQSGQKKIQIDTDKKLFERLPAWKTREVSKIQDSFLKRMILHQAQLVFDRDIAYALTLRQSEDYSEIFRFIGYCIYAKVPDVQIAKRWNIRVKQVEAIRLLFFDFSHFPKDRIANFTYLRQMTFAGVFNDDDFAYYKRVYDLGELGIKVQTDFHSLTPREREIAMEYLGRTVVETTLNLNFSIKDAKDAHAYSAQVARIGVHAIQSAELENLRAKTEQIKTMTRRIDSEMQNQNNDDVSVLDQKFINLLREYSLQDHVHQYRSVQELQNS